MQCNFRCACVKDKIEIDGEDGEGGRTDLNVESERDDSERIG